jgi:hypothetical protein
VGGRDRLADQRVAHHEVVGANEANEGSDDEDPSGRQHPGQGQNHRQGSEEDVGGTRRTQHDPAAELIAQHPEHRRGQGAKKLERAEGSEEQDGTGVDHHVPGQDEGLHLGGPRREEVSRPLEAKAADPEGGEDQRAKDVSST